MALVPGTVIATIHGKKHVGTPNLRVSGVWRFGVFVWHGEIDLPTVSPPLRTWRIEMGGGGESDENQPRLPVDTDMEVGMLMGERNAPPA